MAIIERQKITFSIVFGMDAMVDSSLIAELLAAAVLFTSYPATKLENLPEVRQLSPIEMVREICPDNPQECHGIVAQFDWESPQIRLSTALDLNGIEGRSFLLHELVHALQHLYRPIYGSADCQQNLLGEQEAYRIQNTYLAREGSQARHGVMLHYVRCPANAKSTEVLLPVRGQENNDYAAFELFMEARFPQGLNR